MSGDAAQFLAALAIGAAFGTLVQRYRFCMVATLGNLVAVGDWRHAHALGAAWLAAILGTAALTSLGAVDIAATPPRAIPLGVLNVLLGGLVFGFGAALAGGCAARLMIRSAEGQLGALATLASFALSATLSTAFMNKESFRGYGGLTVPGDLPDSIGQLLGIGDVVAAGLAALVLLALWWRTRQQSDPRLILAGLLCGALVVAAWWVSGAHEAAPQPLSIIDGLKLGLRAPVTDAAPAFGFSTGIPAGMLLGAWASALVSGHFRWTAPQGRQFALQLGGGALMGLGAALAGGCNIGQGLSGVSTLALQSLLAAGAMVGGVIMGIKWWERRT